MKMSFSKLIFVMYQVERDIRSCSEESEDSSEEREMAQLRFLNGTTNGAHHHTD